MNQAKSDGRETMTNGGGQPAPQPELLNQILESTIVLNWKELTKNAEALIHVDSSWNNNRERMNFVCPQVSQAFGTEFIGAIV